MTWGEVARDYEWKAERFERMAEAERGTLAVREASPFAAVDPMIAANRAAVESYTRMAAEWRAKAADLRRRLSPS